MPSLLDREKQLCAAISQLTADRGFPPTLRELAPVLGVSLARIAQVVASCQRKGLVTSAPGICRTLRVVASRQEGSAA